MADAIRIEEFQDSFIVHFGTDERRISAYTLASALIAIADAAKAANAVINPGYEVEILVEALGQGSFRAKVRALYRAAGNLFTSQDVRAIVLNIIAAYIFQVALAPDQIRVVVNNDEVLIQQDGETIVVPRATYSALEAAEQSSAFRGSVSEIFVAVEKDPAVSSLGVAQHMHPHTTPSFEVPRSKFPAAIASGTQALTVDREIAERTELQIMRAILEKSRRRWEFVWRGVRIAAPVTDERFYADFAARRFTIAPGDKLEVQLRIRQRRDTGTGVLINDVNGYEVVEVFRHIPQPRQDEIR